MAWPCVPGKGQPHERCMGKLMAAASLGGISAPGTSVYQPVIKIMHQALINVTRSQQAPAHQEIACPPFLSPSNPVIYSGAVQNTIHPGKPLHRSQHPPGLAADPRGGLRPCRGFALVTLAGRRICLLGAALSATGSRKLPVPGPQRCIVNPQGHLFSVVLMTVLGYAGLALP